MMGICAGGPVQIPFSMGSTKIATVRKSNARVQEKSDRVSRRTARVQEKSNRVSRRTARVQGKTDQYRVRTAPVPKELLIRTNNFLKKEKSLH